MTSMSVWLGGLLIFGLVVLGVVQTVTEVSHGSELAGAVTADVVNGPSQRDLNLCMNGCMEGCVTHIEEQESCLAACNAECGA